MMFNKIKLGELLNQKKAHSQTGPFGTQLKASNYVHSGIPVINVKNIGFGDIRSEGLEFVTEEFSNVLKQHQLKENDIVFGRKGAVERHALISKNEAGWVQGSDCIRLRLLTKDYDPKFLSYFFRTEYHKQWMINLGSFGATMGSLNQEIISKIEIPDIPLPIQAKIASILSAYDELIENNKQRIKLLEEMAEEIYKEWFVRMRFPGYESTKFYNEEGKEVPHGTKDALPEGWEYIKVRDAFSIQGGGTPKTEINEYWEEGKINWFSPTDITGSDSIFLEKSAKQISQLGLAKSSAKIFPKKSVMMTSRATIGAVGINITEACTNQGFITCIPNSNFSYPYIYEWIKSNKILMENYSCGATFKEISRGVFKNLNILKPSTPIMKKFTEVMVCLFDELHILGAKNELLQQTRDLLLPRLISGKLSVEHLIKEEEEKLSMAAEPVSGYGEK
ncbi:restriction endonuclease subunit S [Cytophagaceae bacterium ABcell3]|nr:restriction endonuclease subunit S [Cytophagaceae bacterium ABcell3]